MWGPVFMARRVLPGCEVDDIQIWRVAAYEGASKSFRTESITKYMLTTTKTR
jgi:hypothetical protein